MLGMDRVYVIRHKWYQEGLSIRQIARDLEISRNTVRKYIDDAGGPGQPARSKRARPVLEKVHERIDEILEEWSTRTTDNQRVTGTLVHRQLRAEGYEVGSTTVRSYLAEPRRQRQEVYVPLSWRPGDAAQVDFFEVTVEVAGERLKALTWAGSCLLPEVPSSRESRSSGTRSVRRTHWRRKARCSDAAVSAASGVRSPNQGAPFHRKKLCRARLSTMGSDSDGRRPLKARLVEAEIDRSARVFQAAKCAGAMHEFFHARREPPEVLDGDGDASRRHRGGGSRRHADSNESHDGGRQAQSQNWVTSANLRGYVRFSETVSQPRLRPPVRCSRQAPHSSGQCTSCLLL